MKNGFITLLLLGALPAFAQFPPPTPTPPIATNTPPAQAIQQPAQPIQQPLVAAALPNPEADKLPLHKWLNNYDGYQKALQWQAINHADIFVYFQSDMTKSQLGLCQWFEKHGLRSGPVRLELEKYIKVEIEIPSNKETEALAQSFGVGRFPSIYIVKPDTRRLKCAVFDWTGTAPRLLEPEELVKLFQATSQTLPRGARFAPKPALTNAIPAVLTTNQPLPTAQPAPFQPPAPPPAFNAPPPPPQPPPSDDRIPAGNRPRPNSHRVPQNIPPAW